MGFEDIYVKPESLEGEYAYDSTNHRWVLDISEIKPMFPDARSDEELTRKCASYSRLIYNYLWKKVATYNRSFVEWLISCTEEGKRSVLDALKEQAEADAESGVNSLRLASKVDLSNGNVIKEDLLDASIAPMAKEIIENAKVSVGSFDVYFTRMVNYGIRLAPVAYEKWEY